MNSCTQDDYLSTHKLASPEDELKSGISYETIGFNALLHHRQLREKLRISNYKTTGAASEKKRLFIPLGQTKYLMRTEGITKIQQDGVTTFTVSLYDRSSPSRIVNLVLITQENTPAEMYLVNYDLTDSERNAFMAREYVDFSDKVTLHPLDNVMGISTFVDVVEVPGCVKLVWTEHNCEIGGHAPGEECDLEGDRRAYTDLEIIIIGDCSGGSGGSGSGSGSGPGGPGSGGPGGGFGGAPGGSSGGPPNDRVNTTPSMPTTFDKFYLSLENHTLLRWLDDPANHDKREALEDYLNEPFVAVLKTDPNPGPTIAEQKANRFAFVIEAIKVLMDEGDVDWEEEIILAPTFVNNDKIYFVYNQMNKGDKGIRKLIEDFYDTQNPVQLEFKVASNLNCGGIQANGCTYAYLESNHLVTIVIDENYINNITWKGATYQTPLLLLSETLAHEAIHASLFLAIHSETDLPYDDAFKVLFENYRDQEGQHGLMADRYVDIIAAVIEHTHQYLNDQQFIDYINEGVTLPNGELWNWDDFYKNIAWKGLGKTDAGENYIFQNGDEYYFYLNETASLSTHEIPINVMPDE